MTPNRRELSPDDLRRECNLVSCGASSTAELPQLDGIIGQERATRALEFGLDIPSYGFNMFAMGPSGAGKTTTIKAYLDRKAGNEPVPDDWCYVNNFRQPDQPRAIRLPAHVACKFRDAMDDMLKSLRDAIPRAFEGEEYLGHRNKIARELEERRKVALKELNDFVEQRGFSLIQTPMGLVIVPVINGEVVSPEQYDKLEPEVRNKLEEQRTERQQSMERRLDSSLWLPR
jgi:Cdc6-like AAA superfamily ATPase